MRLAKISALAGLALTLAASAALAAPVTSNRSADNASTRQTDIVAQCTAALAGLPDTATDQVQHLTPSARAYCESVVRG